MGDPGLFGFVKKGLGLVGSLGIPGISTAAGLVSRIMPGGGATAPRMAAPTRGFAPPPLPPQQPRFPFGINPPFGGAPGAGVRIGKVHLGATPAAPLGPMSLNGMGGAAPAGGAKLACPPGFRPNKTTYTLRSGEVVPAGGRCVKIRRRNPLNPRALDRAIGRLRSAKRAAKVLSSVSIREKC
ncbi:MAG: hypothetical protein GWO02_08445 [Gammaproteobacteria bacterium]|nr:hypothetical protein [Gammaproteobacteria bacterium]